MNPKDRTKLNDLAIDLSKSAGQQILKVPGIRAVLITLVGDDTPLGVLVYDKEHQNAETLIHAIARLSEHISVLANGLTGEQDGPADASAAVRQRTEVPSRADVCDEAHRSASEISDASAEGSS